MSFVALAVVGGIGAIGGALIQGSAAESAANTQAGALENAQGIQQGMFNTIQQNEAPYIQAGAGAESNLNYLLGIGPNPGTAPGGAAGGGFGSLNAPFTAQTFQSMSPAYQFQLQQGRQGVLNQDASQQGAESGAAMKDLISFNQGMANTSFNNAFNQYQTQQTNTFNRLAGIAGLGSSAGAASTTGAPQFAQSIGQTASNIGTAQAAGQIGVANAVSGGLQGATGYYNMSQSLPWLMANNSSTPSPGFVEGGP
jgi:hypothetical protein